MCTADDPRAVLNESTDAVLTEIVEFLPGQCTYKELCSRFSWEMMDNLIHIGLLRKDGDFILLDTPVIVHEDLVHLHSCFSESVSHMAESILQRKEDFFSLAKRIDNGFPPETNLFHILCASIFDGRFFEFLSQHNIVSTSRVHSSGLDYLIIVYEKTVDLDYFSRRILCSYNRFSDGPRALQSFGDGDGNRVDAFRFMLQKQLGQVPARLMHIEKIWDSLGLENIRAKLLDEMQRFIETGSCDDRCYQLMSLFGYIKNGKIAVPVYSKESIPIINELEGLTEECICEEMKYALSTSETTSSLLCSKHGVSITVIANELYHIVFGQLNEILVDRGFVSEPIKRIGEGRYLQSIEIM